MSTQRDDMERTTDLANKTKEQILSSRALDSQIQFKRRDVPPGVEILMLRIKLSVARGINNSLENRIRV